MATREQELGQRRILRRAHKRAARRAALRDARPKRKSKITELIRGKKTYLYKQKEIEAKVAARKPSRAKDIFAEERRAKRKKEIQATHLSRQSKRQLLWLPESDYQDAMKALKK